MPCLSVTRWHSIKKTYRGAIGDNHEISTDGPLCDCDYSFCGIIFVQKIQTGSENCRLMSGQEKLQFESVLKVAIDH